MKRLLVALLGVTVLTFGVAFTAYAGAPSEAKVLVDQAQLTLRDFQAAPEMSWFREALADAKGVLVVPSLVKAGLVFGGSGGKGVYFIRDGNTGLCKGPAFYNLGSITFGLQIGIEQAEIVILAMSDEAVRAMLSPQFKLGADASIAAGPVGIGAAGHAGLPGSAFIVFSRAKGAFVGLTVEGAVVTVDKDYNAIYYGKAVDTNDILIAGKSGPSGGLCAMIERPAIKKR